MKKEDPVDRKKLRILFGAIFLASFSLIALEITLSRLLSVLLSYHYVFAILSLALLGLGAGGIFLHLCRSWITKQKEEFRVLVFSASLFSIGISLSVIFIIYMGGSEILRGFLSLYCLLLFLPFFFAGIFFAEVYRLFPSISGRTYGIDLIGAATGSLGAIFFLNLLGGLTVHFLLGIVASLSAFLLAMMRTTKTSKAILTAALSFGISSALLVTNLAGFYHAKVPIGANPAKEIHDALSESSFRGKIIETRWSAFGRTDLVRFSHDPGRVGKLVLSRRKARKGRNPATGEEIKIPAKTVVKMRIAKACKDAIVPLKK